MGPVAAPQGLVCLTMMTRGLVEFLREFPAGIEVDEVVEAEFFALQLGCTCDAEAGAVAVERGALVGILTVAQGLRQRHVDAQRCGKRAAVQLIVSPAR